MFLTVFLLLAGLVVIVTAGLVYLFTPPRDFPKDIPTIPFYYTLLPLIQNNDQVDLYRKYLEQPLTEYGAVKLFFGGRWNILVRKPEYIAEVFKHEDIYAKSGNQKKIPHGVLAEYTGDNIISAHGENWRLYTSIIKPGLQQDYDPAQIWKNSRLLVDLFLEQQASGGSVVVNALLQRYTLANLSEVLLGSSFETLQKPNAPLHAFQLRIKPKIFDPIFLNFPFLDHLNLSTRQEARKLVAEFTDELCNTVQKGHTDCHSHEKAVPKNLGCRLLRAHETGMLTERQLRHNMISTFLAGHENPQLLLISALFLLADHRGIQERLRAEVTSLDSSDPTPQTLASLPLLNAVIYEVLRLYPPISQLINRQTKSHTLLGGKIPVPAGTYLGYNAYSTNRDIEFWGATADEFRPGRWGSNMDEINALFRRANAKGAFISFHGGRRACLGQKFAMLEARVALVALLTRVRWELDPEWPRMMTPAGPLYARNLRLRFYDVKTG
ncbi:cytochrome P450 monooxygenase xanG [Aspergillus puulaauensis]|uniref:Cytochrome P450-dit2 n=1 Tax=Aspergillus puulaauensis TaxID=1220207 RepID=A0A7R7XZJ2_9EURO|nr:cytochrome P450-dit2 [Aspergillus puulaauensis]BCS29504.1 cytochrome P450-dit2 [Aspergillus puulaauensis]